MLYTFPCSFFVAMDTIGKIQESGCDFDLDRYYDTIFFIPYKLSHELSSPNSNERILQKPTVKNARSKLFLAFAKPLTDVLRITVLYKQARILAIDAERRCYRSTDLDQ